MARYNRGEDPRELAVRRVDRLGHAVGRTFRLGTTEPRGLSQATWRIHSGQYRLWCTLRGHRAAGMHARLR